MIMKQRLLLTAFVLLAAVAGRADELINSTNFPDAKFRNWVLSQWFGKDGVLTHDEVLNITQINLTNKGIADLKGIEHFEALEDLYCPGNNLTYLNLSKNTALIQLSCGNNQLNYLNVSKNTALEFLSCGNNQLTYLDVSKNTALKELHCYFNQLTELDLSKNKGLILLRIYNNQIKGKAMDALIASLPTVTNRDLHVIGYEGEQNDITVEQVKAVKAKGWNPLYYANGSVHECTGSLSINETNFPDANFRKWLRIQGYGIDDVLTDHEIADITEIDVTEKSISNMKGIEFFTALKWLYCSGNNLTSLDVSKNTALIWLYCKNNQLTELDVSKNTALLRLSCYSNQLTSLDVSKNTALYYLSCGYNPLTALDVSKNTALEYLQCGLIQLTTLDVSKNTALKELYCSSNRLTTLDVSKNIALTKLDCSKNRLTELDIRSNKNLEILDCEENRLKTLLLYNNEYLHSIVCYHNQISGTDMDFLIESLPFCSYGSICVLNPEQKGEGNLMTTEQVSKAKARGWTTYYVDGEDEYGIPMWCEYSGTDDPNAIASPIGETEEGAVYDLSGRRVEKPGKGIFICNGKKVAVK